MHLPHIAPFWKLNISKSDLSAYLERTIKAENKRAFLVYLNDYPAAYLIAYDIFQDSLKDFYEAKAGDLGMHLLIGSREHLNKQDGLMIIRAMTAFLMKKYDCMRIIGEPDARNRIVIPILKTIGGEHTGNLNLPHKKASLLIGSKSRFDKYMSDKNIVFLKEPNPTDYFFLKAGALCEKDVSN
jgi:hypothetical protein